MTAGGCGRRPPRPCGGLFHRSRSCRRRSTAPAVAGGAAAIATVLLVSPDAEGLLPEAREIVGEEGGASFWTVGGTGKLLARLVAGDGYGLRKRLAPLVGLLNGQAGLPKVWTL